MAKDINDIPMSWDDEIEKDGDGYRVLPEGEYNFTVEDFARSRHEGSAKMAACPKAELTIKIHDAGGDVTVSHNLFLNRKCEWALCAFFTAIRARMPGEVLKMNWSIVKGATGRCKVGIRTWTGNDGKEHESNEILSFINPFEGKPGFAVPNDNNLHSHAYDQQVAAMSHKATPSNDESAYTQEPLTSVRRYPNKPFTPGSFGN